MCMCVVSMTNKKVPMSRENLIYCFVCGTIIDVSFVKIIT